MVTNQKCPLTIFPEKHLPPALPIEVSFKKKTKNKTKGIWKPEGVKKKRKFSCQFLCSDFPRS